MGVGVCGGQDEISPERDLVWKQEERKQSTLQSKTKGKPELWSKVRTRNPSDKDTESEMEPENQNAQIEVTFVIEESSEEEQVWASECG